MRWVSSLLLASSTLVSTTVYEFDSDWNPAFPAGGHTFSGVAIYEALHEARSDPPDTSFVYVTQRGNASLDPVVVLNGTDGSFVRSWGKKDVALDKTTPDKPTWGAHGIAIEHCTYHCVGDEDPYIGSFRVYVEDFTGFTVRSFSATGKLVRSLGTPGLPGNGTDPIQFDHVADATIVAGELASDASFWASPSLIYATDGDGGSANRVVKVEVPSDPSKDPRTVWATPHMFHNPHSITLHTASGLLIVADREDAQLRVLRATDGAFVGALDCGFGFGLTKGGRPYGVRTLQYGGLDLLFVASMDNPQDHKNQKISVVDVANLHERAPNCSILQTIHVPPAEYSGPHLLGVDHRNGDLYAALVADAPRSTVLRYKWLER
jgi:hypothetical protein